MKDKAVKTVVMGKSDLVTRIVAEQRTMGLATASRTAEELCRLAMGILEVTRNERENAISAAYAAKMIPMLIQLYLAQEIGSEAERQAQIDLLDK